MRHYRILLKLQSPLGTPLHSGTLFGHLCWALRETQGEPALEHWLAGLRQSPFLISDGFPAGWLPRPLLEPAKRSQPPADPGERRQFFDQLKKRRKARWMRREDFLRLREALSRPALEETQAEPGDFLKSAQAPHNRIDRRSGHTLEEGGLFFLEEQWPPRAGLNWEVYVCAEMQAGDLHELFEHVGCCGYGRDASWGRGRFSVLAVEAEQQLFAFQGNRLMTVSHGSLSANMLEPRYRMECHLGRLGNFLARSENPFKYPLLLLQPGATFRPADGGPFGELLEDVHPHPPEGIRIRHNAWHLTVAYNETAAD